MTLSTTQAKSDRLTPALGVLTLVLMLVGLYVGLTSPPDVNQGTLVRILFIHVPAAWLSYLAYGGTGLFGLLYLVTRQRRFDRLSMSSAEMGLMFTVATIIVGMLWAKPTWGAYWVWEPRLTTTALSLVIYGGYLLVRSLIEEPERRARVSAVIGIVGTLYVPVNYMAVEWWRGIHQTQTLKLLGSVGFAASPAYGIALAVMTVAFTVLYVYLLRVRGKIALLQEEREEREFETLGAVTARG
ncbi:cytochrome c biogenesis protein CcsA [Deinococcus aquiradiocola]|uniref:Heme exporter protein C n=1 Tax=Deinococcus aquiradiocola TaxID=393059 RepID=A0A917PMJ8_9DEIO|nr:cytochrome c biogenesis protein CcsA [Deinococcus aquiradiocola]GGJ85097.1 cytochrome c-type biogenesis heme exporter protein C [Deinococcus aquiradiocola]